MKLSAYLSSVFILAALATQGQALSDPGANIPGTMPTLPAVTSYPGLTNLTGITKYNYVRSVIPDQPVSTITSATYQRQSTEYVDGLGRPIQTVQKKAHSDGYDIVQHHIYDAAGREAYQYLPFALPVSYSDGKFTPNVNTLYGAFYSGTPGEHPYSKSEFDSSPLNRILKHLAPGASWVGAGRGLQTAYSSNVEPVYWSTATVPTGLRYTGCFPRFIIGSASSSTPTQSGYYGYGELAITRITDEDGNITEEVKDKLGRVVMKRSVAKNTIAPLYPSMPLYANPTNMAYTFYVYDDMDRLRFVIPPEACKPTLGTPITIGSTTTTGCTFPSITTDIGAKLCYRYVYDLRGRLIEKQIPGKGIENYVYDRRDRQVFYQDAKLKLLGKWQFTIYDAHERPVVTGLYTASQTQAQLNTTLTSTTVYTAPNLFYYLKKYDLYATYPTTVTNCEILTYTYYDNYAALPSSGYVYDNTQFPIVTQPYLVQPVIASNTRGLVTGSKIKVLNSSPVQWLTTVNYYDKGGRIIQSIADNHKGGKDISSNVYFFQGMLWKNIFRHNSPSALTIPGSTDLMTTIKVDNTYDRNLSTSGGNDLVWKVTQKINSGTDYEFAYYDYDHLGKTTTKMFPAGNVLHEYNIRGWLNHILAFKPDGLLTSPKTFFEEQLFYDKGFGSKYYNGNISGIIWSGYRATGSLDYKLRSYGYAYDKLNRLTHAEYRDKAASPSSTTWVKTTEDYTTTVSEYDLNGNIKKMKHRGVVPGGGGVQDIDDLTYTYATNSNQLIKVEDVVPAATTATLPDFKNGSVATTEYYYDDNGNMRRDANKGIDTDIPYNYLNKPENVTVTGKGSIAYVYDALGNKLKKTITPTSGSPVVYDYIGNFVYKDNRLEYILNEEGRTRPVVNVAGTTKYTYDYFVKDHLGNVRSTVSANPITIEYLAEHEIATYGAEHLVFDNIPNVWDVNPSASPGNEQAAHLVASDPSKRIGTAIMLRTMPGDEFRISVDAYHEGGYTPGSTVTPATMISSLTSALMGGETYTGVPVSEMPQNMAIISQMMNNPSLASQFGTMLSGETDPSKPQAYLSYLMFDPNLNLIPGKSGSVQMPLGTGSGLPWTEISPAILSGEMLTATVPGFIIIFIHNNSIGKDVWFDNLKIEHYNSNSLDENHYYPFGLTLTSTAAGAKENPYKYNTKELEKSFGLEMYDYTARQYDPQIGRWLMVDPLSEKMRRHSPYNYALNNPIRFVDPDGMSPSDYYDYGAHYLGSVGTGTDLRLISKEDYYKYLLFSGLLQGVSREIDVVDNQLFYRHIVYEVGEIDHKESLHVIALDTKNARLVMEPLGGAGTENTAEVNTTKFGTDYPNGLRGDDATVPGSGGTKVITGFFHPHPTPTDGSILHEGVSTTDNGNGGNDKKVAAETGVTVYAIDKNYIHMIRPNKEAQDKLDRNTEIMINSLEIKGEKLP